MTVPVRDRQTQSYQSHVRYGRELRDDFDKLQRVVVGTPNGVQVPLEELAELRFVNGPGMTKSEAAQLVGYVYVDVAGRDTGSYMDDARKVVGTMVSRRGAAPPVTFGC